MFNLKSRCNDDGRHRNGILFIFCTYDMNRLHFVCIRYVQLIYYCYYLLIVRLDENGEPLSKNALKKLLKKEAADKKKAEKAAARVSSQYTSFNLCYMH